MDKIFSELLQEKLGNDYTNIKALGKRGGTSQIFTADHSAFKSTPRKRAIKILNYEKAEDADTINIFEKEVRLLTLLSHPSLPTIYANNNILFNDKKLSYCVTDYYEQGTISKYLSSIPNDECRFQIIKLLFSQLLSVLSYIHSKSIYNLDIKPDNLLITIPQPDKPQLILSDFCAAEKIDDGVDQRVVVSTKENWPIDYQNRFEIDRSNPARLTIPLTKNEIRPHFDLHMVGKIFKVLLCKISSIHSEYEKELSYFISISERLLFIPGQEKHVIPSASETMEIIDKWKYSRSQTAFLMDGYIRVPGFGIRHFSSNIRALVDTSLFQRLRNIKQLALVSNVFPGANHSRFEHSIGALETALNYISALCSNGNSPWFLQEITKQQISYTAIYSLLHDVGHYPFSHVIDEIVPDTSHDIILYKLLNRDETLIKYLPNAERYSDELADVLKRHWDITDMKNISPYIEYFSNRSKRWPHDTPETEQAIWHVLRDIVNGPIDADKLDYLQRDGLHCGVPYANSIDRDRLFASLSIKQSPERIPKLIVTYKGRVCAEAIAVSRYMLFSEVYWGHAVRSFTAMLQVCIEELLKGRYDDSQKLLFNELGLFDKSDEEALKIITSSLPNFTPAKDLIKRIPFSRLLVLSALNEDEREAYSIISNARGSSKKIPKKWSSFRKSLKSIISKDILRNGISADDIIIDVPDPGKYNIEELYFSPELTPDKQVEISPLWKSVREAFQHSARKIRIYVEPCKLSINKTERLKCEIKLKNMICKEFPELINSKAGE